MYSMSQSINKNRTIAHKKCQNSTDIRKMCAKYEQKMAKLFTFVRCVI